MRRRRPVVEDMAEMAAATAAMHLGTVHPVASIRRGLDRPLHRIVEARPAGAALEFLLRHEQRLAASRADERAVTFLIVQRTAPGSFGPVAAQDLVLLGREQPAPLLVAMGDLELLVVHDICSSVPASRCDRSGSSHTTAIASISSRRLGLASPRRMQSVLAGG